MNIQVKVCCCFKAKKKEFRVSERESEKRNERSLILYFRI